MYVFHVYPTVKVSEGIRKKPFMTVLIIVGNQEEGLAVAKT